MTNWELYLATHRNGGTSGHDENQNRAIAQLQEDILKKVNVFPSTIETNYTNYPLSPNVTYLDEIDFNDFASNQFYQVDISGFDEPINAPPSGSKGTLLYIKNTQIFIDKNNQIWSRIYTDSWSDWEAANKITQEQKEEIFTSILKIKTVETYLFANIFNQIVWSEKGSPTYPLGWRLGYYKNETGTLNYRTTNNKYISTVNAWSFTDNNEVRIKCPDGYKIRYSVYDISGVYSGEYSEYYNELVFTPETDKRYKFSINGFNEDAEDYVANSAFLATIDGRIIVSPSRATRIDQLIDKQDTKPSMKILAIGNSWCRDSVRWLWNILDEAGYNAKIVQAYMGGSSLYHQYFGINDPDYSYTHSSWQQKTHNTFQSWTYTSESPVLSPPSSDYANGQNGIGLTLQEIVESDTWDYVVVMGTHSYIASRKQYVDTGLSNTYINSNNETVTETWDINDFITKIKSWCTNQPKVFFMTAWSISKNTVGTSWTNATEHYTDLWTQAEQDRTAFYELLNDSIDTSLKFGLYHMGDIIDGCINLAKALYYARQNEYLSLFGFDMQRTESNTHLADGLPMYLCSFTIANSLFGIRANDIFAVPNFGNRNNNIDTDAGEEDVSSVSETKGIVYMAKCCGEKANHNTI